MQDQRQCIHSGQPSPLAYSGYFHSPLYHKCISRLATVYPGCTHEQQFAGLAEAQTQFPCAPVERNPGFQMQPGASSALDSFPSVLEATWSLKYSDSNCAIPTAMHPFGAEPSPLAYSWYFDSPLYHKCISHLATVRPGCTHEQQFAGLAEAQTQFPCASVERNPGFRVQPGASSALDSFPSVLEPTWEWNHTQQKTEPPAANREPPLLSQSGLATSNHNRGSRRV